MDVNSKTLIECITERGRVEVTVRVRCIGARGITSILAPITLLVVTTLGQHRSTIASAGTPPLVEVAAVVLLSSPRQGLRD